MKGIVDVVVVAMNRMDRINVCVMATALWQIFASTPLPESAECNSATLYCPQVACNVLSHFSGCCPNKTVYTTRQKKKKLFRFQFCTNTHTLIRPIDGRTGGKLRL